ncbi:MAG: bifunctional isocitrate dehydrogenase kinase/phosphatase [Bacteroidota bacterium]
MTDSPNPGPSAADVARLIDEGFEAYHNRFQALTRRATGCFARQAWAESAQDDRERLALYEKTVQQTLRRVRGVLGAETESRERWAEARAAYAERRRGERNAELAETYYNSITRRVFATVGVDPLIEFVADGLTVPESMEASPCSSRVPLGPTTAGTVESVLRGYALGVPFEDIGRDARRVAERIEARLSETGAGGIDRVEMLEAVFYRNKAAYLIGRIVAATAEGEAVVPLVLPVLHGDGEGVRVDTALLTSNAVSLVFSFTRSYFHVVSPQPWALVRFLQTIMPRKRTAELYISLGYTKHGKTELYRALCAHLAETDDCFETARGTPGMVMRVFTLPGFDVVFKIIKDRFDPPKQTTRAEVMRQYRFVMLHDRVGRLADVQAYEHLEFPRDRFDPDLLDELLAVAGQTVHVRGDDVVIEHLYTERRVTPLNLYLREVDEAAQHSAVVDCGYAIKDLAAANIFPGDMLVKNFGVTRQRRVIFYDYDELGLLSEFAFRALPEARDEVERMSAEAWFHVAPGDVFPEEIGTFLGLPARLRPLFLQHHGDLLDPAFWHAMQAWQRDDEPVDIFPYPPSQRFPQR